MVLAPEQLSIWDINITESKEKVTENTACVTEFINKVTTTANDKTINPLKPTEEQQKFLDQNKTMENENLSRIIKYSGGGLGIEVNAEEGVRTIYLNRAGEQEFIKDKRLAVLPMDKILYYKEDLQPNSLQEEKLREIKTKYNGAKIVKRKGDLNILVEVPRKVISINPVGWVLEFYEVQAVYEDSEVIKDNVAEDLQHIQQGVKLGDFVQAMYGKEVIEGKIIREYGLGNEILNIIFDNKHTAIGRSHVLKILNI